METSEARKIIESLRYGIPPDGYVCHLTVGRQDEINSLRNRLENQTTETLLLNANYGAGKTHLMRFIREEALRNGWIVSLLTLDAKSGVRFDKLCQIIGAICRNIELPFNQTKGINILLEYLYQYAKTNKMEEETWKQLCNNHKWDRKQLFESELYFLCQRAWFLGDHDIRNYIENCLHYPFKNSDGCVSNIYKTLVLGMRKYYRDSRPKQYFSRDKIDLSQNDNLCWAILRDIHLSAQMIGFKGLVLCFDEFEDIIYNMPRINQKKLPLNLQKREYLQNWLKDETISHILSRLSKAALIEMKGSLII
jgi:hypothetical protein